MIVRVAIENLVIVERAEFEPGPGLTAITGETGAGKTLLATAIALLFGGDANAGQVGPGASQAWVEGEFEPDEAFWTHPDVATLADLRPEVDAPLVLARRVDANGRSRAMAWGRTVAKGDLEAAGRLLVATAGQHVQVRLRSSEVQRATLDSAGGADHRELLASMAAAHETYCIARDAFDRVREQAEEVQRRGDQLRDDLARIDTVEPSEEDERELRAARDRARHHAAIVDALARTDAILGGESGGDGVSGAIDLAGRAYAELQAAIELDPTLDELAGIVLGAQEALSDAAAQVASRLGDLADGPVAIDEIEDRLAAYDELKRYFGGTIQSVLAVWEQLREQVEVLDDSTGALQRAEQQRDAALAAATKIAERLTTSRRALSDRLAANVHELLAELGMAGSVFRVAVGEASLTATGADRVDLLLAPAEGIQPRPVAKVASGGELSRIALALLVATMSGDDEFRVGTILFDEIDAGIGGHTAHAVASMLRRLADHRQVLCITHLPQVAARADAHVVIEKSDAGVGVRTTLTALAGEREVEDEIVRMLGANENDDAAREHARQLRAGTGTGASASATKFVR